MEERSFFGRKILGAARRRSLYINKYIDMGKRGRTGSVPWIRHSFVLGPHLERSGGRQNAFVAFRGTRITRARRGAFSGFYPIYPAIRLPEFSELTQRASRRRAVWNRSCPQIVRFSRHHAEAEGVAMNQTPSRSQIFMVQLVVLLMLCFIVAGAIWYGFSAEVRQRVWTDLIERPGGPLRFRFILQPVMAAIAAWVDGLKDAKLGRSPYFWTILTRRGERGGRLLEGLITTARVILLGLVMDVIYQIIVLKTLYPGEAVVVALLLGFIPYLLLRGPVARIARWRMRAPTK
jgi:hypothetical protein